MGEGKAKRDNPVVGLLVNIVIPVTVLSLLSKEKYLGPMWALIVGLLFPMGWGVRTLVRSRKADILSLIGVVSVVLTGVFGLLELPPEYIAIKEAAVPLLLGILIVVTLKTPWPLVRKLLLTEELFDLERLHGALREQGNETLFEKRLVGLTWGFASAMFLSSGLNYVLARLVLRSEPGTEAFTAELGRMTGLSHVVVLIPCMIVLFLVLNQLFDTLMELTGLRLDDLLAAHHRKTSSPAVDPQAE